MARPESGPPPIAYPVLGFFVFYMFGWAIAVVAKDQPFEWIQGGFGTAGLAWGATAMPYCLWSWGLAVAGGILGYKVSRLK